jgi:hypothetical protein
LVTKLGPNFTDYRQLADRNATHLCVPCSWTMGGRPPAALRMYSIVARVDQPHPPVVFDKPPYAGGEHLLLTNRKDMRWLATTLADPPDGPWLIAVAETGQKHTAPFAAVNRGRSQWTVQMDAATISSDPQTWRHVLSRTVALRAAGFSAAAIESGRPPFVALKKDGLAAWQEHAPRLAPYVGAPLLHLANYMITKETLGDYTATYPTD